MGDKTVSVRLRMQVRDYVQGAGEAIAANRALQASQRDLQGEARKAGISLTSMAGESERSASRVEAAGRKMGRGVLYAAGGLAVLGGTGTALKVLPGLLAGTAAAGAALPTVLGGAAESAVVLKVGLNGVGKALQEVFKEKDPFARMGPNARSLLETTAQLKPELLGLQQGFQQRVLRGTSADLELIATKTIPAVRAGLAQLGSDWADTFAEVSLSLSDKEVTDSWRFALQSADEFFDGVNDRIRPLSHALAGIAADGIPIADQFGKGLLNLLDRFTDRVERAKADGSLSQFFNAGADAARELLDVTGDVLELTGMVAAEVAKQESAFGRGADQLDRYLASGQALADIAGIVHTLTVASEGLHDVLGPLASTLREALADPGTAQSLGQVFDVLGAGSQALSTVLHLLLQFNNLFQGVPLTALAFVAAVSKVRTVVDQVTAATERGAARLVAYGGAAETAGRKLPGLAAGAGKALTALVALDAIHAVIDGFQGDAANMDLISKSVDEFASSGRVGGEVARLFGKNLSDLGNQAEIASGAKGGFGAVVADLERAVPLAGDLAQALGFHSITGVEENFDVLDQSLTDYIKKTGDVRGAQDALNLAVQRSQIPYDDFVKLVPNASAALDDAAAATERMRDGSEGAAERQKLLNAPLKETITLGQQLIDVFNRLNGVNISYAEATIHAEEAIDQLDAGLKKKGGLALSRDGKSFNTDKERGRELLKLTLETAKAAAEAADARKKDNGTVEQAAAVYDGYIKRLRSTLAAHGADKKLIDSLIGSYAQMPPSLAAAGTAATKTAAAVEKIPPVRTFNFKIPGVDASTAKVKTLTATILGVPTSKTTTIAAPTVDPVTGKVRNLATQLSGLPDGSAQITVNAGSAFATIRQVRQSLANLGGAVAAVRNQAGGVYVRQAAAGLLQPTIAPPGTLYQWAEPETGGELFLPRRGDKRRGRQLLSQGAGWYGMQVVPMADGGIGTPVPAAAGLVNVASAPAAGATRLDYAESALHARDAVGQLNVALRENGRAFTSSTVKGRENLQALYGVIRAAQDAAKTRYEETGSVKAANAAYDGYLRGLRAVLAAQKVGAGTIRALLSLAGRPAYGAQQVRDSSANIAYAKAAIAVGGGISDLADKLSLNLPGVGFGTPEGRENLSNIIGFLEQASTAAQARFELTHDARSAKQLYGSYVFQLKKTLSSAGYPAKTINSLLANYGRITLTPNAAGGAYMAVDGLASLSRAQIYPAGRTAMYGFAEPQTGGELFVPRNGDQQRGRDLLSIGAGWYGGRAVFGGAAGGGVSYDYSSHLTVNARTYNPTSAELAAHQRQIAAEARTGRRQ